MHDARAANDHPSARVHKSRVLWLIGAEKLFRAGCLLLLGTGALRLLHRDVAAELTRWITEMRLDPDGWQLRGLIEKVGLLNDRQLKEISIGAFCYAALLTLEGVGLLLRKTWAEYFTTIMTASLLPLEILELHRRPTLVRATVLAVNVVIVVYLIYRIRRERRARVAGDAASDSHPAPGRG